MTHPTHWPYISGMQPALWICSFSCRVVLFIMLKSSITVFFGGCIWMQRFIMLRQFTSAVALVPILPASIMLQPSLERLCACGLSTRSFAPHIQSKLQCVLKLEALVPQGQFRNLLKTLTDPQAVTVFDVFFKLTYYCILLLLFFLILLCY